MLIEVLDDVLKIAQRPSDKNHQQAIEALRHLSWSIRRNHHLVYFPTMDLIAINNLERFLNPYEITALKHSYAKRQDLKVLRSILSFRVEVSFNHKQNSNTYVIRVNPGDNKQLDLFEECHLLTENVIDAEFYECVALAYQKKNRIDECSVTLSYYPLQGGGATTKQVFRIECKKGRHLCLAILDSDKKWPNYIGNGPTADSFIKDYNQFVYEYGIPYGCYYYIMNEANEIENLIPLYILKCFSNKDQLMFIDNNLSAMPWLDIKKGLEYRLLYDEKASNEWKKVFPFAIDWHLLEQHKRASSDCEDFLTRIKEEFNKPLVEPWGSKILDAVLHPDQKKKGKYNLKKVDRTKFTQAQEKEWDVIGGLVFNWCCCFSRKLL